MVIINRILHIMDTISTLLDKRALALAIKLYGKSGKTKIRRVFYRNF